jgi:hypothetical protein
MSKTKGNWVIKTSVGGYWCGPAHFDKQIRKAQIYHWKEAAEEQIDVIRRRKYISDDTITLEVIPVVEPMELPEHEKLIVDAYNSGFGAGYSEARDRIFEEIDKLHLHVSNEYEARAYEELKKRFGGN